MAHPTLLPCPFCGSEAASWRLQNGAGDITCQGCRAGIYGENVVARWNRRPLLWLPIETAPNDRRILLRFAEGDRIAMGCWSKSDAEWIIDGERLVTATHWLDVYLD